LGNIRSAAFSSDKGKHLVTLDGGPTPLGVLEGEFLTFPKHLVTLDGSQTPVLWEGKSGDRKPLRGHSGTATSATFDAEGKFLLTLSKDGTGRVWDVGERTATERVPALDHAWGKPIDLLFLPEEKITFAAFSPDSTSILVIGEKQTAQIYRPYYCGSRED